MNRPSSSFSLTAIRALSLAAAFALAAALPANSAEPFRPDTLPAVVAPSIPAHSARITDFGAVADGHTLNTAAINRAIEAVAAKGGGRVVIPAGLWRTGPIVLRSRVDLHVESGALVQFSDNRADYPLVETDFEGRPQVRCQSPLSGRDLEHIAITGGGVFDGAGQAWRPVKKGKMTSAQWEKLLDAGGALNAKKDIWYPSDAIRDGNEHSGTRTPEFLQSTRDALRPVLLSLVNCRHVLLDGPTFQNSPSWCVHPLLCEHLTVRRVAIRNPWYAQNGDGLDLDSCRDVVVEHCSFDVGDDAICLKSGRDAAGRARGRPTENVRIRDCIVYHGHGGFVVGSEMSGGVRRVHVSDCTFIGTDVGLRFKSTRGRGGAVEDILVERIRMTGIPGEALLFDLFYGTKAAPEETETETAGASVSTNSPALATAAAAAAAPIPEVSEKTPAFRRIVVRDLVCLGAGRAALMRGLPEMPIEDIRLENVHITATTGILVADARGVSLQATRIHAKEGPALALRDVDGFQTADIKATASQKVLVTVQGARTAAINLRGLGSAASAEAVTISPRTKPNAVTRD